MTLVRGRKRPSNFYLNWKQITKMVCFILVFAGSVYLTSRLHYTQEFPIHHVEVYGVRNLSINQTKHTLLPLVSKGFFAINVNMIKDQLLQEPWVSDVSVRRILPDQIEITLFEKKPIARWNNTSLLSTKGDLFTPKNNPITSNLPQFIGPDGQQLSMLEFYTKINNILNPIHQRVKRLELSPYLTWNIELENGIKVRLGYKDVLTHIGHFVKVYTKIVGQRASDIDYVDLRYPNGFAIRWKTVS